METRLFDGGNEFLAIFTIDGGDIEFGRVPGLCRAMISDRYASRSITSQIPWQIASSG